MLSVITVISQAEHEEELESEDDIIDENEDPEAEQVGSVSVGFNFERLVF